MPTYILLSALTSKGRQTMHKNPDRLELVNRELAEYDCKLLAQYATLGQYDYVTVIQAPDNESVVRLSVALGSRGTVNIQTLPAISTIVLRNKLKEPPKKKVEAPAKKARAKAAKAPARKPRAKRA